MDFRLEFSPLVAERKITHQDKIFLIGSCFSENLGNKLLSHKFNVLQNPHGILFNPFSIVSAIKDCIDNRQIMEEDLFHYNEGYHSWTHHGLHSKPTLDEAVQSINRATQESHQFLKDVNVVIITLGSAFGYELTAEAPSYKNDFIVANNHKGPASWFKRKLISTQSIKQILLDVIEKLKILNKNIQIIFTVSPVRHLREGFVENNRSKAIVLNALHEINDEDNSVSYFPAYELVIDDLRDYRFFAEDMVHPNYAATNYVWQKFQEVNFSTETRRLIKQLEELNLSVAHRPFNNDSEAHRKFKETQLAKTLLLQESHPTLDFKNELNFFSV